MSEMIAYCGLNCFRCSIYRVAREKDDSKTAETKAEIVQLIKSLYGQEYKPEDIAGCDGCRAEGGMRFPGCRTCEIRKCAEKTAVETCAHCDRYPCEKLGKLFATDPGARTQLDEIRDAL